MKQFILFLGLLVLGWQVNAQSPTTSAPTPLEHPLNVVSIYSDTFTNLPIANYDPNWGQTGHTLVNTVFDPTAGGTDFVLAYPNFNYQGTDFGFSEDLSNMEFLHVDIWVDAGITDRMVKVSPINNGSGAAEILVEVPLTPGSWNSVVLPKSDFTGMTWDSVFQIKFDGQFNADGSANATPFDIYVDNIYFSGPPVNDDCDTAIALTINGDLNCTTVTSGSNVMSTASAQADDVTGTPDNDVWFSFMATSTAHDVSLSNIQAVVATSVDMGMGLYDGSGGCASLTLVDDSDPNSFTASGLTIGETYYLRVYGWYGSSSTSYSETTFDVCIGTPPPPPSNDDCSGALPLTITTDNTTFTSFSTDFATEGANELTDCDSFGNLGVWYSFTAPATDLEFLQGASGNPGITIYEGPDCDNLTEITANCLNNSSGSLSGLTVGNTYYAMVWTDSAQTTAEFVLYYVTCPAPANITVTSTTTDTAVFSWDNVAEADGGFDWIVFNQGDDPDTATEVAQGNFAVGTSGQITGLTASTDYDLYMTSICGASTSVNAGPIPFSTSCAAFLAPFTESFDGTSIPTCWSQSATATSTGAWIFGGAGTNSVNCTSATDNTGNGGNYAWMDQSGNDVGVVLELPLIDVSALTNPYLEFYHFLCTVGYSPANETYIEAFDGTTWNQVGFINTGSATWEKFGYDLTSFVINTNFVQLRFRVESGGSTNDFWGDNAIDDVSVVEQPACFAPSNFMASNVTATSVDLSWDQNPTEVNGSEWVVMNSGDMPDPATSAATGTVATGVTMAMVTGLADSSDYDAYVRTDCDTNGISGWSSVASFSTPCLPEVAPYTQSFDATTMPTCWSQSEDSGDGWEFDGISWNTSECSDSPADHTGNSGSYAALDHSGTDAGVVLQMPDVDVSALTVPYLQFYHFMCTVGYTPPNDTFIEAYDGTSWNQVGVVNTGSASWAEYGFDVSAYVYNTNLVRLRFRAESGGSSNDFYGDVAIDDVSIVEAPSCIGPSSVTVSTITATTVDLSWVASSTEDNGYSWIVFLQGADPNVDTEVSQGNFMSGSTSGQITGLSGQTAYDVYLTALCGADVSSAAGPISFTTACDAFPINFVEDFSALSSNVNTSLNCWAEGSGIFTTVGSSGWGSQTFNNDSANDNGNGTALYVNLYNSGGQTNEFVTTPVIDLGAGDPNMFLSYDVFVKPWSGDNQVTDMGPHSVSVVISTDGGATWDLAANTLTTYDTNNIPNDLSNTLETISLASYSGQIQLGFLTDEDGTTFDFRFYIDNLYVGTPPPPANDNACDAIPLTVGAPSAGDAYTNELATAEPNEPVPACFNGGINGSVWFTFVAPASGDVTVTTDIVGGTLTDTEIAVYDAPGDCADLSTFAAELGCNQDAFQTIPFNSVLTLPTLTPGNTYYIQVDQWGTATPGTFGIRVLDNSPPCPEPTNLSVTGITDTTADLNWDDVTDATLGFNWEVYTSPSDPSVDTPVASGNVGFGVTTANVTGLMADTVYDFYVVSDCDANGTSVFAGPSTFTTLPATVIVDCSSGTPASTTVCYDDNADLIYTFTSNDGTPLRATFIEGYFEDCCDDIIIYDGLTTSDPILFQSDPNFNNDATGIEAISTGDSILVRITSDGSVSCGSGSGSPALNFEVGCISTDELDFYNLQWPPNGNIALGDQFDVYAQAYEAGLTDASDMPAVGIESWIGYSAVDSSPDTAADWTWVVATANPGFDFTQNNDEYILNLGAEIGNTGTYYYASRWRLNGGPYTYGGILPDGTNGGEWGTNGFASGVLTINPPVGDSCNDPLIVGALPYTDTNDTANFTDVYDGSPGTNCGSTSNYLSGNDVVYSYTATFDGEINVELTGAGNWTGVFMYADCADIGTSCVDGGVNGSGGGDIVLNNITVTNGNTYYFVVSTWPSPQTTPYTLTIDQVITADVQIIHNSADPAAQFVDVYFDGVLELPNVEFRTATPFISAIAGVPTLVEITAAGDPTVQYSTTVTLMDGESYVIVASGVLDPTLFDDSVNTPIDFNLEVYAGAQQASTNPGETSLLIHHGATDAPAVDAIEISVPAGPLAQDIAYPQFQGYVNVPTADFLVNVETADNSGLVATYSAPLATLGTSDLALTVIASGFLDPIANQNGEAFGIWVALPTGGPLVELPLVAPATAAPDPTEDSNDVISLFSNVYTDVTVDTFLTPWSNSQLNDVQVQGNDTKRYHALDFAGIETVVNPVDASGMDLFHMDVWSPNATTFRVKLVDLGTGGPIEGEIAFNIPQQQWVSLQIPLDDFADPALVTNPANLLTVRNSLQQLIISGLPVGAVTAYVDNIYFSKESTAAVQIIHNSADPTAQNVDIYVNGNLEFANVAFRTASPFVDVPAGSLIDIDVAPAGSTDVGDSIYNYQFAPIADLSYILVANGVLDPTQFDQTVNPSIAFGFNLISGVVQTALNAGETSILVHHGSTDAPTVDIVETSVPAGTLVDDISYPNFSTYATVPTANYVLNVELADNSAVVASYEANLATLGTADLAITVLASGFLDPIANQNGAGFGLWAALPTGGALIELPLITVANVGFEFDNFSFYPNPVENNIYLQSTSVVEQVKVINLLGQEVLTQMPNHVSPTLNLETLQSGTYIMRVIIDGTSKNFKFVKE